MRFLTVSGSKPGVVRIQVNSCTRAAPDCLRFDREAQPGDGLATIWDMVSLRSAMASPPAAALMVRGTFSRDAGATLSLTNTDSVSGGFTLHSGTAVNSAGVTLSTIAGTPPLASVVQSDASLALPDLALVPANPVNDGNNRMFNSVFGMWPATYVAQPGLVAVDCSAGCAAAAVNDAVLLNPGHVVHVTGAGPLRVDADIGTALAPVLIVADGNVEFTATPQTVFGVIYSRNASWTTAGIGTLKYQRKSLLSDCSPNLF